MQRNRKTAKETKPLPTIEAAVATWNIRKDVAWQRGEIMEEFEPHEWRADRHGWLIEYCEYGETHSHTGWVLHCDRTLECDGPTGPPVMEPMHWWIAHVLKTSPDEIQEWMEVGQLNWFSNHY